MAEFINPFSGVIPDRKLTDRELARAIRMALSAEQEAVHLYEALADATDNALAREVLQDIANEERVHAGEFQRLLSILLPDEDALLAEGAAEVDEMGAGSGGAAKEEA
jgi:rubrerythrin